MPVYYACLLSLGLLLVTIHWTSTASLRSFSRSPSKKPFGRRYPTGVVLEELSTPEPVLSRRRPLLPSSERERRRRWSDDEVLIDETIVEQFTMTVTVASETTTEINAQTVSGDNSTVEEFNAPVLKQNVIELAQTDDLSAVVINDESSSNNSTTNGDNGGNSTMASITLLTTLTNEATEVETTPSEISSTDITALQPVTSNERNTTIADSIENLTMAETSTKFQSSPFEFSLSTITTGNETETSTSVNPRNQTELEVTDAPQTTSQDSTVSSPAVDTAIILLDYTTILAAATATEDNDTSTNAETTTVVEYNTTVVDEDTNSTALITLDTTQTPTTVLEQEFDNMTVIVDGLQNDTSVVVTNETDYTNETTTSLPESPPEPICDLSCQCAKECRYGFELVNDTCECDPPCKNYQCFGNDTCIVTNEGQPFCAPQNGTEHDRPQRCYQPRDAGYHETSMRYHNRWYYNPDQDTCHLFVYRGLGGNANNFQTLHECHLECITCAPAPDPGECLGRLPMWYYDHKKSQCSKFDYSGCKGNDNKFLRKQECIDTCLTRILNL